MCKLYLHNIGQYCTTRGDQHDGALNGVVIADETLHGQVNEHSCHQPDSEDGEQSAEDLWTSVGGKHHHNWVKALRRRCQMQKKPRKVAIAKKKKKNIILERFLKTHSRCCCCKRTCPVPAIVEPVCGRSGGEPEGQQADNEAEKVHQQVGGVRHHSKAACEIATCRKIIVQSAGIDYIMTSNIFIQQCLPLHHL